MEARRLVLASASPRRRALLAALGLRFDVVASDLEEPIPAGMLPAGVAVTLALDKATAVHAVQQDAVVLGADTLVVGGDLRDPSGVVYYGKPADARDAVRMLEELSGRTHYVITGAAVVWSDGMGDAAPLRCRAEAVTTRVRFRKLSPEEIEAYVATGEPMDKAGERRPAWRASWATTTTLWASASLRRGVCCEGWWGIWGLCRPCRSCPSRSHAQVAAFAEGVVQR